MKLEITIKILFDLLSNKRVSATYLAEKYGVSARSVYRYVQELENAGVPIYTASGKGGGFAIVDTYKINSTFMTIAEFENVISALTSFIESVPDKTVSNAISKLKSVTKNENNDFCITSGDLIIDASPWGDTVGYKSKLSVIKASIDQAKQLNITYHDRNGEITERTIDPHLIVFKQGLWYVYAYCNLRQGYRFFKTGRIEKATLLNTPFVKKQFSREDLPLDFWNNGKNYERIEMEVDKNVLSDVEEWLGIENFEQNGEKFIARATLPYDNGLVTKIMSYGKGIRILSPVNLIKAVKENAQELLKNYDNGG